MNCNKCLVGQIQHTSFLLEGKTFDVFGCNRCDNQPSFVSGDSSRLNSQGPIPQDKSMTTKQVKKKVQKTELLNYAQGVKDGYSTGIQKAKEIIIASMDEVNKDTKMSLLNKTALTVFLSKTLIQLTGLEK
jgi:hypothetical protein